MGLRLQTRARAGSWTSKLLSSPSTLSISPPQNTAMPLGSSLKLICWSSGDSTDYMTSSWKCSFCGLRPTDRETLSCVRLKLHSASWLRGLLGGGGMSGLRGTRSSRELSWVMSMETYSRGDLRPCRICWQSWGRILSVLRMEVSVQVWWPLIKLLYSNTPNGPSLFTLYPHLFLQAWSLDKSLCLHQYIGSREMSRYEGRLDHLELLKNAYSHNRHAKLRDGMIVFEKDGRFPLSQPTAWVAKQSGKNYSLGALWLYLESQTGRLHEYMEKVTELGVESVIKPDRKEIEAYFISGDERYSCINQQLKVELSTRSKVREQPNIGFQPVEAPSKRHKRDPMEAELQVMEFISKFERPICSKTRSLRCPNKSLDPLLKLLHTSSEQGKNDEKQLRIGMFAGGKKVPIIIVPENHNAGNLCLANIEKLLANGQYVSNPPKLPDHQRKCEIFLTIRGRKMTFQVCSNPKLLPPSEWGSVVAVFVQGRKQEFEGWPCSDPALIFRQAKGFLLHFAGKDDSEAPLWNVKELTLDRNMRYRDLSVQREILHEIESLLFLPVEQGVQM